MAAPVITPNAAFDFPFPPGCTIFSSDFAVANGPVTWSISSGALPAGYTVGDGFDPDTGAVQGTTTAQGTFTFTIRATNGDGFDEWATSLDMSDWELPSIDPTAPPAGETGVFYYFMFAETGPGFEVNCNTWTVISGALPPGMDPLLASAGGAELSGTPTTPGTFNFTLRAANPTGNDTQAFTITVEGDVVPSVPCVGGFDCFGATGILTINDQALNCPAWDIPNLTRLWVEAAERGDNKTLAGVGIGRRGNPTRFDVVEFDLSFVLTGDVDPDGNPNANSWIGLAANLDLLWTNVFAPVDSGRGTRPATLTMPSGATRTATVQVDPLTFPDDINDPSFAVAVIHLTVLSGRFA